MMDKEIELKMNSKVTVKENFKAINTCIHFETLNEQVRKSCPLFNSSIDDIDIKLDNSEKKKGKKARNNISKANNDGHSNDDLLGGNIIDCDNDIPNVTIGDYSSTSNGYNQFSEINPSCEVVFERSPNIKLELGNFVKAVENSNRVLEIIPENAILYNNRGNAQNRLGNYLAAIEEYSKAIDCNPTDSIVYRKKAIAEINLCNYEQALLDFGKSIKINPNDGKTYDSRGVGKAKQGNFVGALADFNKAIAINPFDEEAHNNRGNTKYNLHNKTGASLDWSKAGELRMRKRWINYYNVFQRNGFKSGL